MKGETVVGYKGLVCRYLLETTTLNLVLAKQQI
jgi:hypothetical protein